MHNKNISLLCIKAAISSSLRKKACALIIFMSMLVNGFALSTMEIGKYSLFMITIAATQNVVSMVVSKCNESLVEVTNKMCVYISGMIFGDEAGSGLGGAGKGEESGKKGGTGKTSGVVIKPAMKEIKRGLIKEGEGWHVEKWNVKDIFRGKGVAKGEHGLGSKVLLIFLIYILAIRKRKGISERLNIINRRVMRTRISA